MKLMRLAEQIGRRGKAHNGISNMMFKHISNYQRAIRSSFRETFRKFLNQEMDLYDQFYEYGKLKTYLLETPLYSPHR